MALAHIRSGTIIQRYGSPIGWVKLEDGRQVSPPVEGFVDGNDAVVPIVTEVTDTSSTSNTVTEQTTTVEANRVLVSRTIRDYTAQEIDDQKTQQFDGMQAAQNAAIVDLYRMVNTVAANAGITTQQLIDAANASGLTYDQVKNRVKGLL